LKQIAKDLETNLISENRKGEMKKKKGRGDRFGPAEE
jgi:DNA invertase Pin-like site-specific DNA recombinase